MVFQLIIFAGIVAEIPRALVTTFELGRNWCCVYNHDYWNFRTISCNYYVHCIYGKSIKKNFNKLPKKTNG